MQFKDFVSDEEQAEKKRKEIANIISKIAKPALIDKIENEKTTIIRFEGKGLYDVKPCVFEIIVTLDYFKKLYKGMQRAIYINIIKESNSNRQTDYIAIEVDRLSDVEYAQTLTGIKSYFEKLVATSK